MRKLFVLAAATMMVAPILAVELPESTTPQTLTEGDTATLSITANIPRYVTVLSLDKTITFGTNATGALVTDDDIQSDTSASIEVEGNVDLVAQVHFGAPLRKVDGFYQGHELPTRLDLKYWGTVTKAGHLPYPPAWDGAEETSPNLVAGQIGSNQDYWIQYGARSSSKGLKMEIKASIDRDGLNDPYGDYAQKAGVAGSLTDDPTMVTFMDRY